MKFVALDNSYNLLALFLSPWKDEETVQTLAAYVQRNSVDWGRLLYMANLHFCAPLWFSRLNKDGLLPLLPVELQLFLRHLHQANVERQDILGQAAAAIAVNLHDKAIPVVLLKGAATFCDDLYEDFGARMMGDLDMLIQERHLQGVIKLMTMLGYQAQPDCFDRSAGFFDCNAPHHLPRYLKPGTPVEVEIHFQTGQGQAGRALPAKLAWANTETKPWAGGNLRILQPTYRLLHNTVHALVPRRVYIDTSIVSLGQLAEFAYLARRYSSMIDWRQWLASGIGQGMYRHFKIYLTLAHRLMGMPLPGRATQVPFAGLHVVRISEAGNNRVDYLTRTISPHKNAGRRLKDVAVRIYISWFGCLHRPVWEWQNLCYKQGFRYIPQRLVCLLVCFFRRTLLREAPGAKVLRNRIEKALWLIKKPDS